MYQHCEKELGSIQVASQQNRQQHTLPSSRQHHTVELLNAITADMTHHEFTAYNSAQQDDGATQLHVHGLCNKAQRANSHQTAAAPWCCVAAA